MDLIKVSHFKKSFEQNVVHKDISFSIQKGECLGLVGGSGSGKSVILRSLIGLETPDAGEINIFDKNITQFNDNEWIEHRKKVAYVFQGGALFDSMSVYENIAYPLREHTSLSEKEIEKRINDKLVELGLGDSENAYPAELSGGMQKRLGLARAIILDPEIILYDEPTAGLDPFNTKKIQDMILELKCKGSTSILVTHDIPTALAVCNRLILLIDGKIVEKLSKEEIVNNKESLIHRFTTGENIFDDNTKIKESSL